VCSKDTKGLGNENLYMISFCVYRRTRESAEEDIRKLDQFLSVQGKNLLEVAVILRLSVRNKNLT
jgi:hypothetical protein